MNVGRRPVDVRRPSGHLAVRVHALALDGLGQAVDVVSREPCGQSVFESPLDDQGQAPGFAPNRFLDECFHHAILWPLLYAK